MASNTGRKISDTDRKNSESNLRKTSENNRESVSEDPKGGKKEKWKQKKKINYFLSKEDIKHLLQNTRFSEQELRCGFFKVKDFCYGSIFASSFFIVKSAFL